MSTSSTPTASASIEIEAPADVVWKLVSDLSRMGEWSPETVKVEWKGGATAPAVGASFKGSNQNGNKKWSTIGRIVEFAEPTDLAWEVTAGPGLKIAQWRYRIDEIDERSCRLTESTIDHRPSWMKYLGALASGVKERAPHNIAGMEATLARIKEVAEFAP